MITMNMTNLLRRSTARLFWHAANRSGTRRRQRRDFRFGATHSLELLEVRTLLSGVAITHFRDC
jgi:hypothetical protein